MATSGKFFFGIIFKVARPLIAATRSLETMGSATSQVRKHQNRCGRTEKEKDKDMESYRDVRYTCLDVRDGTPTRMSNGCWQDGIQMNEGRRVANGAPRG